jgi:hypothetical protein
VGAAAGGGACLAAVTYRAGLSSRALGKLGGLPEAAMDALVAAMAIRAGQPAQVTSTIVTFSAASSIT